MLKKVLIGVAAVILLFVIVVALQPSDFRITRTAKMAAPPAAPFAQVNDFHNWEAWSPWAKLDPEAKETFDGASSGVGAKFAWAGNSDVGEGRMTITESRPHELILINLEFIKPFAATNTTEFTFKPEGDETLVTWSMSGKNNFMGRAFCLFMNMDQMVGADFEKGLAAMKSIVEAAPPETAPAGESAPAAESRGETEAGVAPAAGAGADATPGAATDATTDKETDTKPETETETETEEQ